MEPKPTSQTNFQFQISWTQELQNWFTPTMRNEMQSLADRLYIESTGKLILENLEKLDNTVTGDENQPVYDVIIQAYHRWQN
jgi:hypothetical protein